MSDFALPLLSGWLDVYDGGKYVISGTAKKENVPGRYRVRLFVKRTGRLLREIWSNGDGTFTFANLAYQEYFVLSHDHAGTFNAVISDSIFPELQA